MNNNIDIDFKIINDKVHIFKKDKIEIIDYHEFLKKYNKNNIFSNKKYYEEYYINYDYINEKFKIDISKILPKKKKEIPIKIIFKSTVKSKIKI